MLTQQDTYHYIWNPTWEFLRAQLAAVRPAVTPQACVIADWKTLINTGYKLGVKGKSVIVLSQAENWGNIK